MPTIQAVVFDVFGTLFHNEQELWHKTFERLVQEQKLSVEPMQLYTAWRAVEGGFRRRRVDTKSMTLALPFETYEQAWVAATRQVFKDLNLNGDANRAVRMFLDALASRPMFFDVRPTFDALRGKYKLGVLSNADNFYLNGVLNSSGLRKEVHAVLCSENAKAYKPMPSLFFAILSKLGVAPDAAVYVGDTPLEDVLGPQRVGMRAVWLNRASASGGHTPGDPSPDAEIHTLTELPGVLAELEMRPAAHAAEVR